MIYDNSTLDVTPVSRALDPYTVVVNSDWISMKGIRDLEGVEDHVAVARFGLRRFFFRTTHLPSIEDDDEKVWPYAAFLPLGSYLKRIKETGRDIVAIHFLEDAQQSITTLITSERILSRVQQIPKSQDAKFLSDVLTPFVQKEGSAEFEVEILEEEKLAPPMISSAFVPLEDHNTSESMARIFKIAATLILILSIVMAADSFRINARNSGLSERLRNIQQQKAQIQQQISSIATKIRNEDFAKYLNSERSILQLLEQLPDTCSIKAHDPKTGKIEFDYECLRNLPQTYRNKIEVDPAEKTVSISIS
jgi:hypothetical protein